MAAFRSERIFGVTAEETLSLSSKDSERFHDFSNCFVQILLAPLRGANQFCPGVRGCRCAQHRATVFQPSGLGRAASRGLRGSLYFAAPSWLGTPSRRLRDRRVFVTLVEAAWSRLEACQRVAGGRSAAETSSTIQKIKHPGGVPQRSSIML